MAKKFDEFLWVIFIVVWVIVLSLLVLGGIRRAYAQETQTEGQGAPQVFLVPLQDRAYTPVYEGSGELGQVGIAFASASNSQLKNAWISLDLFESKEVKVEGMLLYGTTPLYEPIFAPRRPVRSGDGKVYLSAFLNEEALAELNSRGWASLLLWADFTGSGSFSYAMSFVGTTEGGDIVKARVESRKIQVLPQGILTVSIDSSQPMMASTIASGTSKNGVLVMRLCASWEPIDIEQIILKGTKAVRMVGSSHGIVWKNAPNTLVEEYYLREVGVVPAWECMTLTISMAAKEIDGDQVKEGDLVQIWVVQNRVHAFGIYSQEWVDSKEPELRSVPYTIVPREE